MKVKIDKDVIIKALKKEPLRAGSFMHVENNNGPLTCAVCAVGAVLRNTFDVSNIDDMDFAILAEKVCLNQFCSTDRSPSILLQQGNYLGALSVYFELKMENENNITKNLRVNLVKFVQKNFPKQITIEVDPAYLGDK